VSKKQKGSSKLEIVQVQDLVPTRESILLDENKRLQLELNELKNKIEQNAKKKETPIKLIVTDEELIAQVQLERLKYKALEQELTIEEIKKYDLLVKNKRLVEGNSTFNADYKKLPDNVTDEELIQIAATPVKEKHEQEE
jgi:cell division septum initiation protein DivIVA